MIQPIRGELLVNCSWLSQAGPIRDELHWNGSLTCHYKWWGENWVIHWTLQVLTIVASWHSELIWHLLNFLRPWVDYWDSLIIRVDYWDNLILLSWHFEWITEHLDLWLVSWLVSMADMLSCGLYGQATGSHHQVSHHLPHFTFHFCKLLQQLDCKKSCVLSNWHLYGLHCTLCIRLPTSYSYVPSSSGNLYLNSKCL